MEFLKQSTTINVKFGPVIDIDDGFSAITGATLTVKLTKNGGSLAVRNSATAISHDADGYYTVELNATDTGTLGRLRATARNDAVHLPLWTDFMVMPANVWDSLFGADRLQVHADEISAGLITAGTFAAGAIDAAVLSADAGTELANALMDLTNGIETGLTPRKALQVAAAALAGVISGADSSVVSIKNAVANNKTRVTANVDEFGNRTSVTFDFT